MSKTGWSSGFLTEIASETMQLATCFILTRVDGEVFRFTDHDTDIVFETNRYIAASGFTRSTISTKSDMSVDTLDMEGLIQSDVISEADLQAGKYDHSQFEVFLVKWGLADTDDDNNADELGRASFRKGRLGQMTIKDRTYEVEFRGMKQALAVVQGGVVQAPCAVDLFSPECGLTATDFEVFGVVDSVSSIRRTFTSEEKQSISKTFDLTDIAPSPLGTSSEVTDKYDIVDLRDVRQGDEDEGVTSLVEDANTPDGSELNPFEIANAATDWDVTFRASAMIPGLHWVLTQSIDMSGLGSYVPIEMLAGHLDGRGFELFDLTRISAGPDTEGIALIKHLGNEGTIRRLGLDNFEIGSNGAHVQIASLVNFCAGEIEDCYASDGTIHSIAAEFDKAGLVNIVNATPQEKDNLNHVARVPGRGQVVRRSWASNLIENVNTGNLFFVGGLIGSRIPRQEGNVLYPDKDGKRFLFRGIDEDCFFDEDISTWVTMGGGSRGFLGGERVALGLAFDSSLDVDDSADTLDKSGSFVSNRWNTGQPLTLLLETGVLPGGLSENTTYWINKISNDEISLHNTRREATLDTNRVPLTDATGTFAPFSRGAELRPLDTTTAQTKSTHTGYDFFSHWAIAASDYPRVLDPGRDGGGTVTGAMIRTKGIDVSSLTAYQSSAVSWTGSGTITVYTSTNGTTFTALTSSGDPVAGLSASDPLAGLFVTIIVELAADAQLDTLNFELANNTNVYDDVVGPPATEPTDDDWFVKGQVLWTSGLNKDIAMEVKEWTHSTRTFKLYLEMPFDIQVGDNFTALPGCRKRAAEDCNAKFDNIINYRGFPHVPGNDKYLQVPDSQQ